MNGLNKEALLAAFRDWQNYPSPINHECQAMEAVANAIATYVAIAPPIQYLTLPQNADEAAAMEKVGFHWLKHNAPERLTPEGRALPVEPAADAWNAKAIRDGFPNKIEWIRGYRAHTGASLKDSKDAYERNESFSATPKLDPYYVLERCRTVLGNMAKENEGAIFFRWPIHHEPLRGDARNLLPLIDEALAEDLKS